jgi:biotin synthase-related radical SAM superfamily protein
MLNSIQLLKIKIICQGIQISPEAERKLTSNGAVPLSLFEYPTTAGISLILPDNIFVNAQFSGQFNKSKILLNFDKIRKYYLKFNNREIPVKIIPIPAYYNKKSKWGYYRDAIMSHTDRMRISPILGCSYSCKYCDFNKLQYTKTPIAFLKKAINVALKDKNIKPRHLLISGGTPNPKDQEYLKKVYKEIALSLKKKNIPVDIMLAPIFGLAALDDFKKWGVNGLSINIEIYNKRVADKLNPKKSKLTKKYYFEFIKRAVKIFGKGKVRSILIVGLEPPNETLKGVEKIASLGSDVVLSPFVPSQKAEMCNLKSPSEKELISIYVKSKKIVGKYGVQIGPRCIPCHHLFVPLLETHGRSRGFVLESTDESLEVARELIPVDIGALPDDDRL